MRFIAFAALGVVLATSGVSFAAQCVFDGIGNYSATQTIGPGNPITSLCGHTISGSGGTCTVNLSQNESTGSGTCVTLQGQTTLNLNSYDIHCSSGSSCATGVATQKGASGTNKIIGPGTITGRFTTGASHSGAMDDTIQDVAVTLTATSPPGTTYGIRGLKTITRVVVTGATESGVELDDTSVTLQDSIIHDITGGHGYGVNAVNGGSISGTLIIDNYVNVAAQQGFTVNFTDSTVRAGTCNTVTTCNFLQYYLGSTTCTDSFVNYVGVDFVDNTIVH